MSNARILIAEDNIPFLHTLKEYLKGLMANVVSVMDGITALEFIKTYKPDIVLLDLNIPKINGIELLNKLEYCKDLSTNIIIISGEREFINKIPLQSYKMIKRIFCKPVDFNNIYDNIVKILSKQKNENKLTKMRELLEKFEFNKTSKGYGLLVECFSEIVNNPKSLRNIEKNVYKNIAKRHNFDNINQIKWCISKTIKSMVRYTDKKILNKYFRNSRDISPKYFMVTIYEIINKED